MLVDFLVDVNCVFGIWKGINSNRISSRRPFGERGKVENLYTSLYLKISCLTAWTSSNLQSELTTVLSIDWLTSSTSVCVAAQRGWDRMRILITESVIFHPIGPVSNMLLLRSWASLPERWITKRSQNWWKSLINFNYWRGLQIILCTSVISVDAP